MCFVGFVWEFWTFPKHSVFFQKKGYVMFQQSLKFLLVLNHRAKLFELKYPKNKINELILFFGCWKLLNKSNFLIRVT